MLSNRAPNNPHLFPPPLRGRIEEGGKDGFSLLEVTVAIAILSIVMGLVLFIFHLSSGSFQ